MKRLPSRFRRLDGALADLPVKEPMLLTELDGFLTGLVISPQEIPQVEWMTVVWGAEDGDVPPFEDPLDVQWFASAVLARRDEIARDLTRGRLQPIIDVDERDREPLWEYWIDGFAEAIALRPDAWDDLAGAEATRDQWEMLTTLIEIARGESNLDSVEINTIQDGAVAGLIDAVQHLHAVRFGAMAGSLPNPAEETGTKVGRNDPCPCGSGKKHKRCCG